MTMRAGDAVVPSRDPRKAAKGAWLKHHRTGKILALQDPYGKQFRLIRGVADVGDIVKVRVGHLTAQAVGDGESFYCFKLIERVHHNTVRAVMRSLNLRTKLTLDCDGQWFEVHGD